MKKYIFTLLLLLTYHPGYGQSINSLFNEFGNEKNAEYVHLSPFLMKLGKIFADKEEDTAILQSIRSMKVLHLDECSNAVKTRFAKAVSRLPLNDYEELMRVNDDGEKVRILMKAKKEAIRELLIVCTGSDYTLVCINGKFTPKDIDKLIHSETAKKHERR